MLSNHLANCLFAFKPLFEMSPLFVTAGEQQKDFTLLSHLAENDTERREGLARHTHRVHRAKEPAHRCGANITERLAHRLAIGNIHGGVLMTGA
jgi:hypothetical protein